jgi:hypothetical protein
MKKCTRKEDLKIIISVESDKMGLIPITNKEMMRDIITDFIIHCMSSTNTKNKTRRKY